MGRPINQKFFGNLNSPYHAYPQHKSGTGGEHLASVSVVTTGTYTTIPTATVGSPDFNIPGNTTATIAVTAMKAVSATVANSGTTGTYVTGQILTVTSPGGLATFTLTASGGHVTAAAPLNAGTLTSIASNPLATSVNTGTGIGAQLNVTYGISSFGVTSAGAGYVSVPAVSVTGNGTALAVLASTTNTSINILAWAPTKVDKTANTSGSAISSDILKQEGSRRYHVINNQGYGTVKLVATTATIGTANLIATDVNGSTYYVLKLTAHRASLVRKQMVGSYVFASDSAAEWTIGASTGTIVSIASI